MQIQKKGAYLTMRYQDPTGKWVEVWKMPNDDSRTFLVKGSWVEELCRGR
jgi:hypothetical protein